VGKSGHPIRHEVKVAKVVMRHLVPDDKGRRLVIWTSFVEPTPEEDEPTWSSEGDWGCDPWNYDFERTPTLAATAVRVKPLYNPGRALSSPRLNL
jgi:hypothetical protein